jgi:hypothetical protein
MIIVPILPLEKKLTSKTLPVYIGTYWGPVVLGQDSGLSFRGL